jgi:CheY-like chemotaxis protein
MPRMDGAQLCRCIRSRLGAPYTYFILLTALGDPEHRIAGMQAGADDYLGKPFNLYDLEARLIAAERVTAMHRRREALLRQARRSAAEANPTRLLNDLLREAIALIGGSAGIVTRWDDDSRALVAVGASTPGLEAQQLRLGEGASGRAAQQRKTVLLRRLVDGYPDPVLVDARLESAIAVPLLHDSRLLGTLAVGTADPDKHFTQEDAELLELLGLERARLDGVMLAARTAQHELNNQLTVARGYAELLVDSPDLPPHLAQIAEEVKHAADQAANIVRQLANISHIHERHWPEPADTTIDLAMSQR